MIERLVDNYDIEKMIYPDIQKALIPTKKNLFSASLFDYSSDSDSENNEIRQSIITVKLPKKNIYKTRSQINIYNDLKLRLIDVLKTVA